MSRAAGTASASAPRHRRPASRAAGPHRARGWWVCRVSVWWVAGPRSVSAVIVALTAQAAGGHAGAATLPAVAVGVLVVHLVAAGVWLFVITVALLARRRRSALAILSPYAVAAAVAVAATGVEGAALER